MNISKEERAAYIKENKKLNFQQTMRVFFGRGIITKVSLAIIIVFILVAVFAPYIAPYDPLKQDLVNTLKPFSKDHLFGTDSLGRDLLSRIIYGARISLSSSLLAGILAAVLGITLGLLAGFYGGLINLVIMRITDMILSIPTIIFTIVIAAVMGGGLTSLVIAIGFGMIPSYVRMVNGLVTSLRQNDYIEASGLVGQSNLNILFKHLFPNCFPSLIVIFTINLGSGILTESTLSYLGLGINPPTPSWGSMVFEGYSYLYSAPWMTIVPGLFIVVIIIAFNILGDGLRDALDPRLRGKL